MCTSHDIVLVARATEEFTPLGANTNAGHVPHVKAIQFLLMHAHARKPT